jgi:hypothetical protein
MGLVCAVCAVADRSVRARYGNPGGTSKVGIPGPYELIMKMLTKGLESVK